MRVGRNALGRVSLGYFSLHEQREVTRSSEGRVEALLLKDKQQKLDSNLRWNDERESKDNGFQLPPE